MDNKMNTLSTSSGSSDGMSTGEGRGAGTLKSRQDTVAGAATNNSAQQAMKCPRCDSLNTKFCYFNNYSQTQPRHFCKSCRRYWTAGGALRNVPVGGGCRKNKRVKHAQRPLINLAGGAAHAAGLFDPSSLIDDTTSNMLARLGSTSPFPNFTSSFGGSDDTSTQLLNIAFSRFQESMRLRQQQQSSSDQSPEAAAAPYFDTSFPALVHKPSAPPISCSCGACGSRGAQSIHQGSCNGLMNTFEANLGFASLPVKMEHEAVMAGFCSSGYDLNPILYHEQSANMHNTLDTSATATLASIEDQLSSFSNLQHVDAFDADTSSALLEQKGDPAMEGTKRSMVSGPLQLLGHVDNTTDQMMMMQNTFTDESTKERLMMHNINHHEKHLLNMMMPTDHSSWHQSSQIMSEMLLEPHHSIWNAHAPRWQDNTHPLAATPATVGSVL